MSGVRYNTVTERCHPQTETALLSFVLQHTLNADSYEKSGVDVDKLDRVKEVIETSITGRKYEVLLLRSQGKSMAEISMLLSVSKSTVQNYYRQAIRQVRQTLGLVPKSVQAREEKKKKEPVEEVTV